MGFLSRKQALIQQSLDNILQTLKIAENRKMTVIVSPLLIKKKNRDQAIKDQPTKVGITRQVVSFPK